MQTPQFWKTDNSLSRILEPLGRVYAFATAFRMKSAVPYKASKPVICVGNLTAGGSGKTPVSVAIAETLRDMGRNPFFISRGYGGTIHNVIVNKMVHTPKQVGDEPLLLSEYAPVAVNPDRADAARLAIAHGADCLVMDDGFQNPGLYKDFSFLVFNGTYGIGNGRPIPAGPLREDFMQGIKRADAVIILGEDKTGIAARTKLPVICGDIVEENPSAGQTDILAFAGIGHPEKFYASLEKCGLNVVKKQNFPDHHFYTRKQLQKLINTAQKEKLALYTTEKDFVKIPFAMQQYFNVLKIKIRWQDPEAVRRLLSRVVQNR